MKPTKTAYLGQWQAKACLVDMLTDVTRHITLLQALVVQLFGMLYQHVLLGMAMRHHMKPFLIFLALPSATIRSAAAEPCRVSFSKPKGNNNPFVP